MLAAHGRSSRSSGMVESERTWAAGDSRTHTLGLALKHHLGDHGALAKADSAGGGGGGDSAAGESAKSGGDEAAKEADNPSSRSREEYYIEVPDLAWLRLPCRVLHLALRLLHLACVHA